MEGAMASPDLPLTRGLLWLEKGSDGGAAQREKQGGKRKNKGVER